ncbi:hypothetical protein AVEN_32044-1 [Araneus ventricosus]|uniref:Uncharacterized protein n=1 Tax=Araneus ventricosus TaxID=182803 RepID=A0A4Y2PVU1_ARAVE|nr:hypothetical protein AVEN_32044-1 [Araneus ventricosus]
MNLTCCLSQYGQIHDPCAIENQTKRLEGYGQGDEGLDSLSSFSCSNEILILTDSRSSIQHLANWHRVRDNTGVNILNKLKSLSVSYRIHLKWIPSHVNIQGNEIADAPLTYLELFSRDKGRNKTIWLTTPPVHHWYQGSRPGGCLSIDCNRRDQTTLTRFLSGHIRSLTCSGNSKCFEICPKCTAEQATPDHIPACLGHSKQDLVSNPLLGPRLSSIFLRCTGSWT